MNSDFAFYFELFKKRIPAMAVIFSLCAAIGIAIALILPPRYSADATLAVEGAQIPDDLALSTVQTVANEQLQIIQQRLMTRNNLIDIANKFQVFAGETGLNPDEIVEQMQERTTIELNSGRDSATIMKISFSALSPRIAADVVNELVTIVQSSDAESRIDSAGGTEDFFQQRVESLSIALSERSAEIVKFKEANQDALPDGLEYRLDRQATLQERVNLNARELASLKDQKSRLQALGSASSSDLSTISPDRQQLAAARANLSAELATLSENHPKVKSLRAKIGALEKRVEASATNDPTVPVTTAATMLQLQLAEIDSEMTFLEEEIVRTEEELSVIREAIERTPKVAIRLDELEREYQNTQTEYNEASASRSKAQTGVQIEFSTMGERVTVIEQAVVPNSPTSPNRKLIAGGGVFVGGAIAAVFFVLTELLNRTIRRPVDLMRGLGVQPLATIPHIELPGERKKRQALTAGVFVFIIAAIVIGLVTVHTQYLPLDLLFERVIERVGL